MEGSLRTRFEDLEFILEELPGGDIMLKRAVVALCLGNGESTLPSSGSNTDPYAIFLKILQRGQPPGDWAALRAANHADRV